MTTYFNFTSGNPALARIKALTGAPNSYANFGLSNLPKTMAKEFIAFVDLVANEDLKDDISIISVKFDDEGRFYKTFVPTLYRNDKNEIVVRVGLQVLTFKEAFGGADVEVKNVVLEKYEDATLEVSLEVAEDVWSTWPIPLRLNSEAYEELKDENGTIDVRKLNGFLKKGKLDAFAKMLAEVRVGGNVSYERNEMITLEQLDQATPYSIINARKVKVKFGDTYVITIEMEDGQKFDLWAPYKVKEYLLLGGEIGPETTFQFISYEKDGKTRYSAQVDDLVWPEDEEAFHSK